MHRQRLLLAAALLIVAQAASHGQTFQELYAFACRWDENTGWDCSSNGVGPQCALVQAKDGSFYGTTSGGGRWGCGTIFKISPAGDFTTLAHFDGTNGSSPYGALLEVGNGSFYGTTRYGRGHGTMFSFTTPGAITDLGDIGFQPLGDLAQDPAGDLYLVDLDGGVADYCHGMILRCTTNGSSQLLHMFCGSEGGLYPSGGLLLASDGNFYGVTSLGGAGYGTVYRISTNGDFARIASLGGGYGDASWPNGKLVEAPDGSFYGVAEDSTHVGAVFRVTKGGTLTTVAAGMAGVNQYPIGSLVLARDGNFYGCTYEGGDLLLSRGSVFRMTPQGTVATLFPFTMYGPPYPGAYPYAGLVQGNDGNLYGTTWQGGAGMAGNIFRIIMPGPKLNSTSVGRDLVLSWRTNYTGYVLQSLRDLGGGEWTDCTNAVSAVGGQYFITNSVPGSARFFRLRRISQL